MRIQIDAWQLDTKTRELHGVSDSVRLRPQIFKALTFLIDRAPAVVSKQDLLEAVWDAQAVSDSAIAQVIRELRVLFDDDPASPRIIATRHRQGYQLIAEVQALEAPSAASTPIAAQKSDLETSDAQLPEPQTPDIPPETKAPETQAPETVPTSDPPSRSTGFPVAWIFLAVVLLALVGGWLVRSSTVPSSPPSVDGWPALAAAQPPLQQGLAASRALDTSTALDRLQKAQSLDDTPRLHIHIARQMVHLGRIGRAEIVLDSLQAQRDDMERRDQLFANAVRAEAQGKLDEAARLFGLLTEMHPDDMDFALARWETDAEAEVESTLALLRQASGTEDRQQLVLAQSAGRQHRPEEQLEIAQALFEATEERAPILSALGQIEVGRALRSLGRVETSVEAFSSAGVVLQRFEEMRAASRALRLGVNAAATMRRVDLMRRLLGTYEELVTALQNPAELARLPIFQGRLASIEEDHEGAAAAYALAAQRCESIEAWIPGATALSNRADALQKLGRLDEAEVALRTAMRWSEASELPNLIGQGSLNLANYFARRGDFRQAETYYDRALSSFRQGRYTRGEAAALTNLARVAYQQGRIERSVERNDAARQLFQQMGLEREQGMILVQSARSQLALGDLDGAQRMTREAMDLLQASPSQRLQASATALLAQVALSKGQVSAAHQLLNALEVEPSAPEIAAEVQHQRSRQAREAGNSDFARRFLQDALASFPNPEDAVAAMPLRLELAFLMLERGQPVVAQQEAQELMAMADRNGQTRLERQAALLLTRTLVAQNKLPAARRQLQEAEDLLAKAPDFRGRLELALVEAQIEAAIFAPPSRLADPLEFGGLQANASVRHSIERLRWVLAEATAADHILLALESRVELAKLGAVDLQGRQELSQELEKLGLKRLFHRLNKVLKD